MRKSLFGRRLSRDTNERKALFRSLLTALITHGGITTTEAKAKAVKPWVEKVVTQSKDGSVTSRRILLSQLPNPTLVTKLISSVGPTFLGRPGGYTRIIRFGPRPSDTTSMVRLEFVEVVKDKAPVKKSVKKVVKVAVKPKRVVKKVTAKKVSKKA